MNSAKIRHYDFGAVCLGYVGTTAAWQRPVDNTNPTRLPPMLVISTCSSTDDAAHTPAASITIAGLEALRALQSAVNAALMNEGAAAV